MTGIYKITSPKGKIYIGQSIDIFKRFRYYDSLKCIQQIKLYNSFLKHGIDNHKFEIIELCGESDLNYWERYWQDFYNVLSNGLNCRLQGTNDKSGIGAKKSLESIQKSVNFHKGRKRSKKVCENLSKALKGMPRTDKWKRNISNAKKGNSYRSKKVINIDNGDIYNSAKLAAIDMNINVNTLRNKLNGNKMNNTNLKYLQDV